MNPICGEGVYIADPHAHRWSNGRLYVYGSKDVIRERYCSEEYDVLETADMRNWIRHRCSFSSENPECGAPPGCMLFAPDALEKDGRYYLFYSHSCEVSNDEPLQNEGVAVSASPCGPFTEGAAIPGISGIDPGVFRDDGGKVYLVWGQFSMSMAELAPGMRTVIPETIRHEVVDEERHFFHEGAQLFKHNGLYYLAYTDTSRRGLPTCIGYAVAPNPFGPYEYRGVIIDNYGSDPDVWNNHGYVAQFNGKWYIFYHRATHNCNSMRKACVEPIEFRADGSIAEVEMTSSGAGGLLDPFAAVPAFSACLLHGSAFIAAEPSGGEYLVNIRDKDGAAWKYFDFHAKPARMVIRLIAKAGGRITFSDRNFWHRFAEVEIPPGDGKSISVITVPVLGDLSGKTAVFMRFSGLPDCELFQLKEFYFV